MGNLYQATLQTPKPKYPYVNLVAWMLKLAAGGLFAARLPYEVEGLSQELQVTFDPDDIKVVRVLSSAYYPHIYMCVYIYGPQNYKDQNMLYIGF